MPAQSRSKALHTELMAPEAFTRVKALYALECEADKGVPKELAKALSAFAARGIPFYAPQDPQYQAWVSKAVAYWEQVNGGNLSQTPLPPTKSSTKAVRKILAKTTGKAKPAARTAMSIRPGA